eukprot:m.342026 g.342026  ORF g.342026 m.342026 type:complete len:357 (+) comp20823_c0_seq1:97-1167(+)
MRSLLIILFLGLSTVALTDSQQCDQNTQCDCCCYEPLYNGMTAFPVQPYQSGSGFILDSEAVKLPIVTTTTTDAPDDISTVHCIVDSYSMKQMCCEAFVNTLNILAPGAGPLTETDLLQVKSEILSLVIQLSGIDLVNVLDIVYDDMKEKISVILSTDYAPDEVRAFQKELNDIIDMNQAFISTGGSFPVQISPDASSVEDVSDYVIEGELKSFILVCDSANVQGCIPFSQEILGKSKNKKSKSKSKSKSQSSAKSSKSIKTKTKKSVNKIKGGKYSIVLEPENLDTRKTTRGETAFVSIVFLGLFVAVVIYKRQEYKRKGFQRINPEANNNELPLGVNGESFRSVMDLEAQPLLL